MSPGVFMYVSMNPDRALLPIMDHIIAIDAAMGMMQVTSSLQSKKNSMMITKGSTIELARSDIWCAA